jgi:hypothetical protein
MKVIWKQLANLFFPDEKNLSTIWGIINEQQINQQAFYPMQFKTI